MDAVKFFLRRIFSRVMLVRILDDVFVQGNRGIQWKTTEISESTEQRITTVLHLGQQRSLTKDAARLPCVFVTAGNIFTLSALFPFQVGEEIEGSPTFTRDN